MTDEPKCVCGCTKAEHYFQHEQSHYPESRTVELWQACERHNCGNFRPVLDWPDAEGWWWSKRQGAVWFNATSNRIFATEFESGLRPSEWGEYFRNDRFTRCELNPFEMRVT